MVGKLIGAKIDRVDGPLKVTGKARYSAEYNANRMAYAVAVGSAIASGKIRSIDTREAESAPGVLTIITHENRPKLNDGRNFMQGGASAEARMPLSDNNIYHAGQYIAVVVADSLESAQDAASLIKVTYIEEDPILKCEPPTPDKRLQKYTPKEHFGRPVARARGQADSAFSSSAVKVDNIYTTPVQNHNPIETHATTASWDGEKLTVYDATQYLYGVRTDLANIFGLEPGNVRVICKFIGGAFGCKGAMWAHVPLTVLSAKIVNRPVKLVLQRPQMFTNVGHRSATRQRVALGAERDGTLKAVIHEGTSNTAVNDDFLEQFTVATPMLYATPNLRIGQEVLRINRQLPTFMRAPGETPGTYALESALDELAYALNLDPLALRMKNYAYRDPDHDLPFSSKSLDQCYKLGAEKIGWSSRNQQPGISRDGNYLIGYGLATATYPTMHFNGQASCRLKDDGTFVFRSSTHEMGTGTCTVMAQIAADCLNVPLSDVTFELGDTDFPRAPVSGGSATVSTIGNAVFSAAEELKSQLAAQIIEHDDSPFKGQPKENIVFMEGRLTCKTKPGESLTYDQALRILQKDSLECTYSTDFNDHALKYSTHAFGAQFARVRVDQDLGEVRVDRFVGVFACGNIINEKTCRSQAQGGITMGIGMALSEETITDMRSGRILNANLGEYHIPVNLDVPSIEAYFVPEEDQHIGKIGAKGIGEIGITGVAAAVANAVFNATGKRIRDLPITPDKLLSYRGKSS